MIPTILSTAEANSVRCARCNSYLSVGPIQINSNRQPICGRCELPEKDIKCRAIFFEKIAQNMVYPCRNDNYGCDVIKPWGAVQSHEKTCQFQPISCPALDCTSKFRLEVLEEHFKQKHPNLLMKTNTFKVSSKEHKKDFYANSLYTWKNNNYIVQISFYQEACYFNIIGFNGNNKNLFCDLVIKNEKSNEEIHIKQEQICGYHNKGHEHKKMKKIDYNSLEKLLGSDINCTFTISESKEFGTDHFNRKLLSNLECSICFHYMKPPIFTCDNGHCLCQNCKTSLEKCPSCDTQLRGSRNITLEKICEDVLYPCKYIGDKCNFYGKIADLEIHEKSCLMSAGMETLYTCLFNFPIPCPWRGEIREFPLHMKNEHKSHFLVLGSPNIFVWNNECETVMFTTYNGDIFRITLNYGRHLGFKIKIMNISNTKKLNYDFIVNFSSSFIHHEVLILRRNCGNNTLSINRSLVQPFVRKNRISLTINIIDF